MKLTFNGKTYNANRGLIERVAQAAFSYLPRRKGEIELKFVTLSEICALNKTYRGIDAPTDVLSFHIGDEPLVGQLVICYTYTREQAKEFGKTLDDEISLLVLHGILHIYGYDHENSRDEAAMQAIEVKLLQGEGIRR